MMCPVCADSVMEELDEDYYYCERCDYTERLDGFDEAEFSE